MPANKDDGPGLAAQLAEETAAAAEAWPDDWPALRPVITLPRMDRATVMDRYADLIEKMPELQRAAGTDIANEQEAEPEPELDPDRPKRNAGRKAWAAYATGLGLTVHDDVGRDAIIAAVDQAARPTRPTDYRRLAHNTRQAAEVLRLTATLEDVIVLAAVDADATRQWLAVAEDMDIIVMFLRYARRTQLGEASSSGS